MSLSRVNILLTWCNENGIQIDPRIQVQELADRTESSCNSSRARGISVYSLEDFIDCSRSRECLVCIHWMVAIPKLPLGCKPRCSYGVDLLSVFVLAGAGSNPPSSADESNENQDVTQAHT